MATKTRSRRVSAKLKEHVRISEYSDLELMTVLADLGGDEEEVPNETISKRLFGNLVNKSEALRYANQCVGSRMGWMSRFGFVEGGEHKGHWILSAEGLALLNHRLRANFTSGILDTDESSTLHLASAVGERLMTTGDVTFKAMERQLRHSVLQRKRR